MRYANLTLKLNDNLEDALKKLRKKSGDILAEAKDKAYYSSPSVKRRAKLLKKERLKAREAMKKARV